MPRGRNAESYGNFFPAYEENAVSEFRPDTETITIFFDSLTCLGKSFGFTSYSDLKYFMVKRKEIRRMEVPDETAFRLSDRALADTESENSMFMFRVAGSEVCTATENISSYFTGRTCVLIEIIEHTITD